MPTKAVTDQSFESDVIKSKLPTVVDFWALGADHASKLGLFLRKFRMR